MEINTISSSVDSDYKKSVDLEEALKISGFGRFSLKFCVILALFLIFFIVETLGYSYVLPAAKCDLQMTDVQRGLISSIPFIGLVTTSYPWGYLIDTKGRKYILLYTTFTVGIFGVLSAFMPNLLTFAICKIITSICIACPAVIPYTFIGEILPKEYRDFCLSVVNAAQIMGSAIVPLVSWGILPLDFHIDFGLYYFRSWRLLTIINASGFILCGIFLIFLPESPKYLVSKGRYEEALAVLQLVYVGNHNNKTIEDYPVKKLKIVGNDNERKLSFFQSLKEQSIPLLKPKYLKWLCLNGFLLFGVYTTLNGLAVWVPDVLNRVLSGDESEDSTACYVITQGLNQTSNTTTTCIDTIDRITFVINSVANVACSLIALLASTAIRFMSKKYLLILTYLITGVFSISINWFTNNYLFAILLSALPLTAIGIGCVNAYSVEIFPTTLRGMAMSLSMMIGRSGSIFGANLVGILLNAACEATFYSIGGLLLLCALLTMLLPGSQRQNKAETAAPPDVTKL